MKTLYKVTYSYWSGTSKVCFVIASDPTKAQKMIIEFLESNQTLKPSFFNFETIAQENGEPFQLLVE